MDNRQNNDQSNRRNIGSNYRGNNINNNQGNNIYSKYGSNAGYNNRRSINYNSNNNGNNRYGGNSGVRYTDNTGYGNNGSNYNNRYSRQNSNNYGQRKYDDIKGLSEDYEDYSVDMGNLEDDNMDNPIDKKKLVKKRIILGVKIFCISLLAAVLIGGLVIYMMYGKEIMKMRKDAKKIVADTTDETFTKSAQHKFFGVKNVDGVKKIVPLDMGLGNSQYITMSAGGSNMELARDLMIYSEDRNFYKHHGVDFWANVKAVIWMILNGGKADRGGSTITQQLVRNVLLEDFDRTWRRKVKEIFVSWGLETKYQKQVNGKEKLIEFYLNNINFGNEYIGIENAAYGYFGKSVKDLTKGQVAFLCAIPNNPDMYDPTDLTTSKDFPEFKVNKYTWNRKTRLLNQLRKYSPNSIDEEEYKQACAEMIELVDDNKKKKKKTDKYVVNRMLKTFIMKCVKEKIIETEITNFKFKYPYELTSEAQKKLYEEAYKKAYDLAEVKLNQSENTKYIYTSLDVDMIDKLQKSIDEGVVKYGGYNAKKVKDGDANTYAVQGAGVTMDDQGYVVAMVNGRTSKNNATNWLGRAFGCKASAAKDPNLARQPGSSIKPLVVYAPYFEENLKIQKERIKENEGITFRFLDEPVDDSGPYEVQGASSVSNSHNAHNKSRNVRDAIKYSSNVVAYRILENKDNKYNLGLSKGLAYLKKMNFEFLTSNENTRISLGGFQYGSTPLEMCAAYSSILMLNGHVRPTCIKVISDKNIANYQEVEEAQSLIKFRTVFSKDTRTRITEGMKGVFESGGTAAGCKPNNSKWDVAGKTGTTDNNVDAWFCGGTPKYTTSIWVGLDGKRTGNSGFSGPTVAKIWRDYYNLLSQDKGICLEMNTKSTFDESDSCYEPGLGKVVYTTSGSYNEPEATPNIIGATEDVTIITPAPSTQEPDTFPIEPITTEEPDQPIWGDRPTPEIVTEPPTDDGEDDGDDNDSGNDNGNDNGNGNGNNFWNPNR